MLWHAICKTLYIGIIIYLHVQPYHSRACCTFSIRAHAQQLSVRVSWADAKACMFCLRSCSPKAARPTPTRPSWLPQGSTLLARGSLLLRLNRLPVHVVSVERGLDGFGSREGGRERVHERQRHEIIEAHLSHTVVPRMTLKCFGLLDGQTGRVGGNTFTLRACAASRGHRVAHPSPNTVAPGMPFKKSKALSAAAEVKLKHAIDMLISRCQTTRH